MATKKEVAPIEPEQPLVADPATEQDEMKEAAENGVRLPLPISQIKGTPQEQIVRNWKEQARRGIVFICEVPGCYYPCNYVLDNQGRRLIEKTDDGDAYVMRCSYDPEAHGSHDANGKVAQIHAIPKKDDEL